MSGPLSLSPLDPSAFEMIEEAVAETARGRWFLAEYARRNRNADTEILLGAIGKLENAVSGERAPEGVGRLRGDLMEMAGAIARTRAEMAAINAPNQDQSRLGVASEALDSIVRATERATSDILGAAEEVQEAAWTLRESGADGAICDELDRRATQIYTACSFQDLTAQRTGRIVHTLRYLEERLIAMIAIWGEDADVPPAPGERAHTASSDPILDDLCQSDVDRYIDMEALAVTAEPRFAEPRFAEPLPGQPAGRTPLPIHEDLIFIPTPEAADDLVFEVDAHAIVAPEEAPPPVQDTDEGIDDDMDETAAGPVRFVIDDETMIEEADDALSPTQDRDDAAAESLPFLIDDEVSAAEMADELPAGTAAVQAESAVEVARSKPAAEPIPEFADLDDLTLEQKLALFT